MIAVVPASNAAAQVITWNGPTSGSQNLASTTTLALTTPGTYIITVDTSMVVTFKGAAGGGGGASGYASLLPTAGGWDAQYGGGGGGGGAVTAGTTVQLLLGKTYTLIVGAGGAGGVAAFTNSSYVSNPGAVGGNSTLTNTTDAVTLVSLTGGGRGSSNNGGSGGTLAVGTNAVTGGGGGYGAPPVGGSPVVGGTGGSVTNGAAGGGGGGAGDNDSGSGSGGGDGGSGGSAGGTGGPAPWNAGGNNNGLAAQGGWGATWGGGGAGGGGGVSFVGATGSFGGGGGGGGGIGTGPEASSSSSWSGRGGNGQSGVGVFVFVSVCAYAPSPTAVSLPVTAWSATIALTTSSGCAWTATSNANWITITAGASGSASGTVSYTASANNTGRGRTGTLTVGGQTVTMNQAAGASSDPVITWSGTASGSQNLAAISQVAWTQPGTYAVTVNNDMLLTFRGVAGGGAGGGNGSSGDGGGGGGGGARTTGTVLALTSGQTYTLVVGAGGAGGYSPGASGGATSFTNTTDNVVLIGLGGGTGGTRQTSGTGGLVTAGSNGVTGGPGGQGAGENTGLGGLAGYAYPGGTGGGGGAGGFNWNANSGTSGAAGGFSSGGPPSGSGGATGVAGGSANGVAAGGGASGGADGGGGGGGAGAWFTGVSGTFGGGGGGGGGSITAYRGGGAGQNGAAVLIAPCAYNVVPIAITSPAAASSGSLAVTADGCGWTATSNASWLTVTAGTSGNGNGTVTYQVGSNLSGGVRSATLTVGGQSISVTQIAIDHVIVTPSSSTVNFRGTQTLAATAYDANNAVLPNVAFTWTTANANVATVAGASANTATVTAVGVSASAITITATPTSGPNGSAQITAVPGQVLVFDPFGGQTGTPIAQHQPVVNQLGGAWIVDGSPGVIVGGGAYPSGPGDSTVRAIIDAGASDVTVKAAWSPASTDNAYGGIVFRKSDASNFWVACYFGTEVYLLRHTALGIEVVAQAEVGPRQTRQLEVHLNASAIQVSSDGELKLQEFDWFNAAATQYGLEWWNYGDPWSAMGNFEVDGVLAPEVATLILTGAATILVDQTQTITVNAFDGNGQPVPGAIVRWMSSNPIVATDEPSTPLTTSVMAHDLGTSTFTANVARGPLSGASIAINVISCVDPLTPGTVVATSAAGSSSVSVTGQAGCSWNARSESAWITITGGATGTGSRSVTYSISANTNPVPRGGTIFLGGRRLHVTQDAMACSFNIWPGSGTWAGDGGPGGLDVTPGPESCTWAASTGEPWIHVTTPSGAGFGTVRFSVDANPSSSARSGTIAIGGGPGTVLYLITQSTTGTTGGGNSSGSGDSGPGPACTDAITPPYIHAVPRGGNGLIQLAIADQCSWTVSTNASWIHVTPTSGTSATILSVSVDPGDSNTRYGQIFFSTGAIVSLAQSEHFGPAIRLLPPDDPGPIGRLSNDDEPLEDDPGHCDGESDDCAPSIVITFPIDGPAQPPDPFPSSIHVRCRPLTNPVGNAAGGLHCYIVAKKGNAFVQGVPYIETIEGLRVPTVPLERLAVDIYPGENGNINSNNSPFDPEIRMFDDQAVKNDIGCIEATGKRIDQMRLPYDLAGPNSNSVVYTIMNICKRPVQLPPGAVGATVPLGPIR